MLTTYVFVTRVNPGLEDLLESLLHGLTLIVYTVATTPVVTMLAYMGISVSVDSDKAGAYNTIPR